MRTLTSLVGCAILALITLHCSGSGGGVFTPEEDVVDVVIEGSDAIFYIPTGTSEGSNGTTLSDVSIGDANGNLVGVDDAQLIPTDAAPSPNTDIIGDLVDVIMDTSVDDASSSDIGTPADIVVDVAPYCPKGDYCDDGNPCTLLDECVEEGSCVGTSKNCDDENPCTNDSCDTETGTCTHTELSDISCDEGVGLCSDGVCLQVCPDGSLGGCPVIAQGNVVINTPEEYEAYFETTQVDGNLTINLPDGIPTFPNLESISGSLLVADTSGITGFGMTNLTALGGSLLFGNSESLNGFDLPLLETIGISINVFNNPILVHLNFPKLESVGTSITMTDNAQLQNLTFPKLEGPLPELVIKNNGALPQCMAYLLKDQVLPASINIEEGNCNECKCD